MRAAHRTVNRPSFLVGLVAFTLLPAAAGARLLRVEVEGLGGALSGLLETRSLSGTTIRQNVLSVLSIERASREEENGLTEGRIRELHSQAPQEIERALQPFGYYRPAIRSSLEKREDGWVATYRIDPGPELRVDSVDVRLSGAGSADPLFRGAVSAFPLTTGDVLNHPRYETGKSAFEEIAAQNGYLDARFDLSEIRVDLDRYRAEVAIHFETGPRYLFGPVTFRQDVLKPELLRGYVTWKEGEPIDTDKLLQFQNALSDAPYFDRVEVVPQRRRAVDLEVPIDVNLVPGKPRRFKLGLGYGTDTGARASARAEFRRLNRSGHRAEVDARASQVEQVVEARYLIPGAYPRTDVLTFLAGYSRLDTTTSQSRTSLAGADRSVSRGRWRESLALIFQRETFEVGVDRGTSRLLIPRASWTRVVADDRIDTRNGSRLDLWVQGAQESLLSTASFLQAGASGKLIRPLSERDRAIGRADVGYTLTSDFRALPPRIRFFAGGDRSVRGYGYQELGPRDERGGVIGGKALAAASLEYEHRFRPRWGGAVFVDAGNAFDAGRGSSGLRTRLEVGAGLGARWISPVGPIRVDGAYGFADGAIRLHVNIGPDL